MPAFAGPQSKPSMSNNTRQMLLDPGFELTLRPMRYPQFYEMYRNAIRNTWTVEEINFQIDISDLHGKMSPADRHLIHRLVASSPPAIPSSPTTWCSICTSTSTRRKRACTCRASCTRKRCTCSST
jgi:Ribonucleotide reductase, beta subunit